MRKIVVLGLLLGLFSTNALSQEEGQGNSLKGYPTSERIFAGGNLGASFGTVQYIYLAPVVGYRITRKFSAGGGVIYRYFKDTRPPEYSAHDYGFNLFTRHTIYGPLFAQVEYEYLNFEYPTDFNGTEWITEREGYNSLFVGGGLAQPMGRNAAIMISAFYNVTYNSSAQVSPYSRPWVFRVGIVGGF